MNRMIDGTEYRSTPTGHVVVRGKRQVFILGTSADQVDKARALIASRSFDRLFRSAKAAPGCDRNTRMIKIGAV